MHKLTRQRHLRHDIVVCPGILKRPAAAKHRPPLPILRLRQGCSYRLAVDSCEAFEPEHFFLLKDAKVRASWSNYHTVHLKVV
jgi:hypothetical protein